MSDRTLRIMHVTDFYAPIVGGLERYVQSLAVESIVQGMKTAVVTQHVPGQPDHVMHEGVEVFRVRSWASRALSRTYEDASRPFVPPMPDPGIVAGVRSAIRTWRPDVIQAHGWIAFSALTKAATGDVPVILTLHDYGAICARKNLTIGDELCSGPEFTKCLKCAPDQYGKAKGTGLVNAIFSSRRLLHRADLIVPVSHAVAASHAPYLPHDVPVEVVPCFMSAEYTVAPRPNWLPAGDFIAFVGALTPHKGINTLLEAAKLMQSGLPLVVVGMPQSDSPTTWPDDVVVHHTAPHDEVMSVFSHARVAVVPSEWPEPGGTVAIEAMRAGAPVVTTNVGGLPEVVAHEVTGLVVPRRDPAALAQAIDRIATNPDERERMSQAALIRAENFTARTATARYRQIYASLATPEVTSA